MVQEYRFRSKDGHYIWMQDEASLLPEAEGQPKEIVGFWTNISERKQAEEQAAQASRLEVDTGEDELTRFNNRIAIRGNCSPSCGYVDSARDFPARVRRIASRAPMERRRAVSMMERMSA